MLRRPKKVVKRQSAYESESSSPSKGDKKDPFLFRCSSAMRIDRRRRRLIHWAVGASAVWIIVRYVLLPLPSYQSRAERDFRQYRFPSIEERVQVYMSEWYNPPCGEGSGQRQRASYQPSSADGHPIVLVSEIPHANGSSRVLAVEPRIEISTLFYYDVAALSECASRAWNLGPYCYDILRSIPSNDDDTPIFLQFGDEDMSRAYLEGSSSSLAYNPRVPHFKKFRKSKTPRKLFDSEDSSTCHKATSAQDFSPILWKLNAKRHYRDLYLVPRYDRRWTNKLDKAIFRGALTNAGERTNGESDLHYCQSVPRCRFVYNNAASDFVDAKLTKLLNKLPENINGVSISAPLLSLWNMLKYKGIISLEGNDVASGLKWTLLSKSVVLMPPPKFTSWAMEELLEPWIHYIPLREDLSDVEEKVLWMIQHDSESQRMSHRASLWIKDLVFHSGARKDDALIYKEMLRRYRLYFQRGL